jgi:hypothetical protein
MKKGRYFFVCEPGATFPLVLTPGYCHVGRWGALDLWAFLVWGPMESEPELPWT